VDEMVSHQTAQVGRVLGLCDTEVG
jgi:hypothetical protein